jgi:hypothetical protein
MISASLGKGEVESSILSCSTIIFIKQINHIARADPISVAALCRFIEPTGTQNGPAEQAPNPSARPLFAGSTGSISIREACWICIAFTTILAGWFWASHQFPETVHQVRRVVLLLVIGGPDG